MILRKLSQSLKTQNWTAIWIEFILLVSGVFLGIQVANWNEARADRIEYLAALSRLGVEIDANLATFDNVDPEIKLALKNGSQALTVLQSCVDSEENRRIVDAGLNEIRGTWGVHPRRKALEEITTNPRLLSQQTAEERKQFSNMLFYFDLMQLESNFAEYHPLEGNMENNPVIQIGEIETLNLDYFGSDWTKSRRKLQLKVPVSEACHNDQLIKSFYSWESWQNNLPAISRKLRIELNASKALIEKHQ